MAKKLSENYDKLFQESFQKFNKEVNKCYEEKIKAVLSKYKIKEFK